MSRATVIWKALATIVLALWASGFTFLASIDPVEPRFDLLRELGVKIPTTTREVYFSRLSMMQDMHSLTSYRVDYPDFDQVPSCIFHDVVPGDLASVPGESRGMDLVLEDGGPVCILRRGSAHDHDVVVTHRNGVILMQSIL